MANRRENPNHNIKHYMPGVVGVCYALSVAGIPSNTYANEIAAIRFTSFEGHIELRFREDKQTTGTGGSGSTETRTSFEEEVFLLSHGYIYHPKFLKVDLGLGPIFTQSKLENADGSVSDNTAELDLLARLSFLEEKPYPLVLYYEKNHPTVALSFTDRYEQQNEKYGFDFQLRQPLLPFKLSLGASRHKNEGEGFNLIIDDVIDQRTVRADIPIGRDGYATLVYNENDLVSKTRFKDPPTQTTTEVSTDTTTLDSRAYFGEKNEFQLSNFLSYVEQHDVRPYKELRYTPELRWAHSEDLESFYRLSYVDSEQETVQTTNYGASTGFRYDASDRTSINASLHAEDNETTGLTLENYGVNSGISHKRDYSFGTLNLSGGWNYDYYDRVVTSPFVPVDIILNFVGTTPQFLPHENIEEPYITTITATRILNGGAEVTLGYAGTACGGVNDTFAAVKIGTRTQVEICEVTPGEDIQVRFQYRYDSGGSVAYSSFVQSYAANLRLYNVTNLFMRYRDHSSSIQSGTPTVSLTESRNAQVGVRVDYPVFGSMMIGGEAVYEEEQGTSFTYNRESYDLYFQFMMLNGSTRIGTHQVTVDYENSNEDIELVRHSLQFRIRPWNRFNLTADLSDEEDTGGSTHRQTKIAALNAQWRIRKLIAVAEARYIDESYGDNDRQRSLIRFTVRREF